MSRRYAAVRAGLTHGKGRNDGSTTSGKRYFRCPRNHGLFIQPKQVELLPMKPGERKDVKHPHELGASKPPSSAALAVPDISESLSEEQKSSGVSREDTQEAIDGGKGAAAALPVSKDKDVLVKASPPTPRGTSKDATSAKTTSTTSKAVSGKDSEKKTPAKGGQKPGAKEGATYTAAKASPAV